MNNSVPKTSGIYKITCMANGKIYVGSSENLRRRWNEHQYRLKNNTHSNQYLQNAWDKYGQESFIFEVVELTTLTMTLEREQYWLDELKSYNKQIGFNISKCVEAPMKGRGGYTHSLETRMKISIGNKGKKLTLKQRAAVSNAQKGKPKSKETRTKMSKAATGRILTNETKSKMACAFEKAYIVINPIGDEMKIKNLRKFCRENNLHDGHMIDVAKGKQKHHKHWKCYYPKDED